MDNASIHLSNELKVICEKAGVLLANLLAYLYNFNFIETSFSFLKSYIRRYS